MLKRWRKLRKDKAGVTLVELIVALLILGILMTITIPAMTRYIDKAKEQKYTMEAQGVKQSIELYMLEQYAGDGVDAMGIMEKLSMEPLDSKNCFLADYLKVKCSKGARIQTVTLQRGSVRIRQMVYLVDKYKIEITDDEVKLTLLR